MGTVRFFAVATVCAISIFAQQIPEDFTDALVANIAAPTALAFTPDGRLLVTTQPGALRVIQNGNLLPAAALTIPSNLICSNSERGLLGIAVDPDFLQNNFIYLYYTFRRSGSVCGAQNSNYPVNRVSRFVLTPANTVDMATERVLIDNIPSYNGNHNGGDVQFGKDGHLYITVGDGGCDFDGGGCAAANDAARDQHTLLGKVLRIDRDGNIPPDNPWQGAGTARCNTGNSTRGLRCQETYGWGLRNPFRIAMDPNAQGVRLFINDVGQNTWEEIDLGQPGADYGWNIREGPCTNSSTSSCTPQFPPPTGIVDPIFAYRAGITVPGTQTSGCSSITGGAFVPNGFWPFEYDNSYLFADFVCGAIFRLTPSGSGFTASDFVRNLGEGSAVAMTFGPFANTQALYYTTYARGGSVRRIAHVSANPRVRVVSAASFAAGPVARGSIATLFGENLATQSETASRLPLPTTLAGVTVQVRDAASTELIAPLIAVFPNQINFIVPERASTAGPALVRVMRGAVMISANFFTIDTTAPGIFTANANGQGPPAAIVVFTGGRVANAFACGIVPGPDACVPAVIDLGATGAEAVLVLFGTGIRGHSGAVTARIGGVEADVLYAGPQSEYEGLDQVNIRLPRSLIGRGEVEVVLTVDGKTTNPVRINIR